jgi:hypothetical protein
MIVRVLGFGKDDPADSKLDFHLSKRQDVTALTGSGRIVIMGDSANKPTLVTTLTDGSSPWEIFSMEAKINPKEFLKTDTIKCLGKYCLMPWYRDLCAHDSMWGLYVPPSFSLQVDYPMGYLWDKRHVGATVHATRGNMSRLLRKLLWNPSMFPRDSFGNTMRDTITNANGDGYAALHKIMRSVHPNLTEKAVEAITPYQCNSVSIAAHVRNMANFLEKEQLRGRLYTQYESLMMVMESLHGRFKESLKKKSELIFTAKHDHFDRIPFKLQMANLGTTLTEWLEELKLDSSRFSRPDAVHHIAQPAFDEEEDDGLIHAIRSDLNCSLCGITGHTMEHCHMFINMINGMQFMKANPGAVSTIQRDHKTFVRNKPRPRTGIHALGTSDQPETPFVNEPNDRPSLTFDDNGYICHLADTSAIDDTDDSSTGELLVHSSPFDPLVEFDDAASPFQPDMDEYLIANISDDADAAGPSSYEAALDMLQNVGMDTQEDGIEQGNALPSSALPLVGSACPL